MFLFVVNKKKIDSYDHLFNFASVSFFVVPPRHDRYWVSIWLYTCVVYGVKKSLKKKPGYRYGPEPEALSVSISLFKAIIP
jgi:hypothetical protein